jgi:hypothetical protein
MLWLDYESDSVPATVLSNGRQRLSVTWDDVLWAAVTVGRPNLFHVFRYGEASVYEAIFRWSMVRMHCSNVDHEGKGLFGPICLSEWTQPRKEQSTTFSDGRLQAVRFEAIGCPVDTSSGCV